MSDSPDKLFTAREGSVLVVTLSEPERRNPISADVRSGLHTAFSVAAEDATIRSIVLTGAGGNFSSGGDISTQSQSVQKKRAQFNDQKGLISKIYNAPVPVIAAVEGWAAGAGFSLALLADTIVASTEARFIAAFPKVGLIPDYGMLHTLPERVGLGRAKQIMLWAKPIGANDGASIGLVDQTCEPGQALNTALALAQDLESVAPKALRATKEYYSGALDRALDYERLIQPDLMQSEDAKEGRLAFSEKRKPQFKDC